jgi:DNA replication protein DnaC
MRPLRTNAEWSGDKQKSQPDPQKRLASSGIPRRFWSSEWDDYHEDSACQAVGDTTRDESLKHCLQAYADGWEPGQYDGLVLLGPAGHGKTLGAALVAKQLCLEANVWVKYTSNVDLGEQHKELFELQHASMRFEDEDSWNDYQQAKIRYGFVTDECDLLVLDDVGKEYHAASGWSAAELDKLLRRRRDRDKATILTSNLSRQDWKIYNQSMLSFLYEVGGGEIIELTGPGRDHRPRSGTSPRRRRQPS